jgi:hypothetical protein
MQLLVLPLLLLLLFVRMLLLGGAGLALRMLLLLLLLDRYVGQAVALSCLQGLVAGLQVCKLLNQRLRLVPTSINKEDDAIHANLSWPRPCKWQTPVSK